MKPLHVRAKMLLDDLATRSSWFDPVRYANSGAPDRLAMIQQLRDTHVYI
jgi:hypothetical protein